MSGRVAWLLGAVLALVGACVNETGAKCDDDSNCPAGQYCLSGACANGAGPADAGDGGLDAGHDAGPFVPAPHAPWPLLVTDGGGVLDSLQLVTITADGDPLSTALRAFGTSLAANDWLQTVGAEYGVGAASSSELATGPAMDGGPDGGITIGQAVEYITGLIDAGAAPRPSGQTVYLFFLPPGLTLTDTTDSAFRNPYPSRATSLGDGYVLIQRGLGESYETQVDRLTKEASQEVIETATDPLFESWGGGGLASPPWTGSTFSAADFAGPVVPCDGTSIEEASFAYTRVFSNAAALDGGDPCRPAVATPYYNVSTAKAWYAVDAGSAVSLPLTGWATGRTPDPSWFLGAFIEHGIGGFDELTDSALGFDAGLGQNGDCTPLHQISNGGAATLDFTVPGDAGPGDYAIIAVTSYFIDPETCSYNSPEDAGDQYHEWFVGVYVP